MNNRIPKVSKILQSLPPYPFVEIDNKKKKAISEGKDIISFGIGDPDLPTPRHIIEAAKNALDNPKHHQYPFGAGLFDFRKAVSQWYEKRFNVLLDPDTEIHSSIGSKDGLSHFILLNAETIFELPQNQPILQPVILKDFEQV